MRGRTGEIPRSARDDARRPPLVKICGVTREEDLELAIALGAGLVGLNFHPPSPRYLPPERAAVLAARARGRVGLVGVFVDRPRAEVEEIDAAVGLDLLQFHGGETPAALAPFGARAVKALRLAPGERPAAGSLAAIFAAYAAAWGFLVDVRHPTLPGGTGESWSWDAVAGADTGGRPLLVAGGIRPDNAGAALAASGAAGLDVCSGVESSPGVKDPELLERLFRTVGSARAVRTAFAGAPADRAARASRALTDDRPPRPSRYDRADADEATSHDPRPRERGPAAPADPTDPPEAPDGEDRAP